MRTRCEYRLTVTVVLAAAGAAAAVDIPFADHVLSDTEMQVGAVLAVDFDQDGFTDVISASGVEDEIVLFRSDGATPPVFTKEVLVPDAPGVISIRALDVDGDGDNDLVALTQSDERVSWYEQEPGPMKTTLYTRHIVEPTGQFPSRVRAGDLDGDTDADILYTTATLLRWLESDGATPPVFTGRTVTTTLLFLTDATSADLDGDGDTDLAACATNGAKLAWYSSDGATPPVFTETPITTTLGAPRAVVVADVNGDLAPDLVVASNVDNTVAWYENDGADPPAFTEHIATTTADGAFAVAVADLDSSGSADLVVAAQTADETRWYDSDGADPPVFTERTVRGAMNAGPVDVLVADLDADADPDVLMAEAGADTVVYTENKLAPVRNTTLGATYQTIADALAAAGDGDDIAVAAFQFAAEPDLDFAGVGAQVRSSGAVTQPAGGAYTLADGARLEAATPGTVTLTGTLTAPLGARIELAGAGVTLPAMGSLLARAGSAVVIESTAAVTNDGLFDLFGAALITDADVVSAGEIAMIAGTLSAGTLTNDGILSGYGDILAETTNTNDLTVLADTQIAGALTNDGTVTVQNGVLTILGMFTNNGTIVGQSGAPRGGVPDGYFVDGALLLGDSASLTLAPGGVIAVTGDVDISTNDAALIALDGAELRVAGLGAVQNIEAMSEDLGADPAGLTPGVPGRFPIGTLRVGPTPAVASLVDAHNNDSDLAALPEAVYVQRLVVETGTELRTNSVRVYYGQLDLLGTVDTPANLIPLMTGCPADLSGDGVVSGPDLAILIAAWGSAGASDLNTDGTTDGSDLAVLLAAWGVCPN